MGFRAEATVFYGFLLPEDIDGWSLKETNNITISNCGDGQDSDNTYQWVGIKQSITSARGYYIPLNTDIITGHGVIEDWKEDLEEFCNTNDLSINAYEVKWYLSAFYG